MAQKLAPSRRLPASPLGGVSPAPGGAEAARLAAGSRTLRSTGTVAGGATACRQRVPGRPSRPQPVSMAARGGRARAPLRWRQHRAALADRGAGGDPVDARPDHRFLSEGRAEDRRPLGTYHSWRDARGRAAGPRAYGASAPAAGCRSPIPGWLGVTAKIVHYGLYVLVAVTVVLGIFNAWQRGDVLFNVYKITQLDPRRPCAEEMPSGSCTAIAPMSC